MIIDNHLFLSYHSRYLNMSRHKFLILPGYLKTDDSVIVDYICLMSPRQIRLIVILYDKALSSMIKYKIKSIIITIRSTQLRAFGPHPRSW